jgi:hypothetical protein
MLTHVTDGAKSKVFWAAWGIGTVTVTVYMLTLVGSGDVPKALVWLLLAVVVVCTPTVIWCGPARRRVRGRRGSRATDVAKS